MSNMGSAFIIVTCVCLTTLAASAGNVSTSVGGVRLTFAGDTGRSLAT